MRGWLYLTAVLALGLVVANQQHAAIPVGWHDELKSAKPWTVIGPENPPQVITTSRGSLSLRLPHVPAGFPYVYQWNGLTRVATVDLGRYPVLMARVRALAPGSYAHLDIEERGYDGHVVRTARSNALTEPGVTMIDLGKAWGSDVRRVYLRLIVGGKLEGVACEYTWVRFVSRDDADFLTLHPDWQRVRYDPGLPYQR